MKKNLLRNEQDDDAFQDTVSAVIDNKQIKRSMDRLTLELSEHMSIVYKQENSQKIIDSHLELLLNGTIDKYKITKLEVETRFNKQQSTKEENSTQLALIYTAMAQHFLNKDLESKAWTAISEAKYYLAYYSGLTDPAKDRLFDRAQKGGLKKSQNAQDLKESVKALLIEKKPKKGWRNPQEAAYDIASELIIKAQEHNLSIPDSRDDLVHKVTNMIHDDKEVKVAFESPTLTARPYSF